MDINVASLFSLIPCWRQNQTEGSEPDQTSRGLDHGFSPSSHPPLAAKPSPNDANSFCTELLEAVEKSCSLILIQLAMHFKDFTIKEKSSLPVKILASAVLSSVSLITVPLALIEGVARRIFGWTLSLLNRILPCGNELLTKANKAFFAKTVRLHLVCSFVAFDHVFDIFEPNKLTREPTKIVEKSVILRILDQKK